MLKSNNRNSALSLHIMILIPVIFIIVFNYGPMLGLVIAFKNFKPGLGIIDSPWVGLEYFRKMFLLDDTTRAIKNTLIIATLKVILNLFMPVVFALMLNEVKRKSIKKGIQTITYLPYFLSWVILSGIFIDILSPDNGIVNRFIMAMGFEPVFFLGDKDVFRSTLVVTDVWKNFGYNAIIYLAALTSIDPTLYEAAAVDGAGHWRRTIHITLPGISAFIALMSILAIGQIMQAGFDQVYNLYNVSVYSTGDIIDTLVYRLGIQQQQYSFSTAVGLFKSVVSLIMISLSNFLAKRYAGYRVF